MPIDLAEETRAEVRSRHGIKFDGTINLGHVLTFLVAMFAGITAWNGMDKRVTVLEEARKVQTDRDAQQDGVLRDRMFDLNQTLQRIDGRLDKIGDQLVNSKAQK